MKPPVKSINCVEVSVRPSGMVVGSAEFDIVVRFTDSDWKSHELGNRRIIPLELFESYFDLIVRQAVDEVKKRLVLDHKPE